MPRNQIGHTSYLLALLLPLLLLLLHDAGCLATPTKATTDTAAAPAAAQVIGATSLAATRAAVYAATDNDDDDDDDHDDNKRNQLEDLMPANLLLEDLQQPNGQLINLTRHHDGDIFYTNGTAGRLVYPQSANPPIRRSAMGIPRCV